MPKMVQKHNIYDIDSIIYRAKVLKVSFAL